MQAASATSAPRTSPTNASVGAPPGCRFPEECGTVGADCCPQPYHQWQDQRIPPPVCEASLLSWPPAAAPWITLPAASVPWSSVAYDTQPRPSCFAMQDGAYCGGPPFNLTEVEPLPPEWSASKLSPVLQQGTCVAEAPGCGRQGASCCHEQTAREVRLVCDKGLVACRRPVGKGGPQLAPSAGVAAVESGGQRGCFCERTC